MNSRSMTKQFFAIAATFALATTLSAEIRTDFNHHADFSKYHTYSWGKVNTSNPLDVSRVENAVNHDLSMRGLKLVSTGGDLVVFAKDHVKTEHDMETTYNGIGGGFGDMGDMGGMGDATTSEVDQRVGKFVLDIFEGSSHKLLFRGVSDQNMSNNSGKNVRMLDKDAAQMLKKLPLKVDKKM